VHVGALHRREDGRLLASLIRVVKDVDVAEDARQGPAQHPVAGLLATARHKVSAQRRRRALAEDKRDERAAPVAPEEATPGPREAVRRIFPCGHPALAPETRVALTRRTIWGLATEASARAFLVPAPPLAPRLVGAKAKITGAGIPTDVPGDDALAERLDPGLAVVSLVVNEDAAASFGADLRRAELGGEAMRRGRPLGAYAVQAAIAALHAPAPSARETDGSQIAALYGVLAGMHPSPVVELNRAVAVAMADGVEQGLARLDTIHPPGYYLLPAAGADLWRRLGRLADEAERRFLERRLAEVTHPTP
jgi:predicted RNA polymerase sigma factor